jgi:hypothetical protein
MLVGSGKNQRKNACEPITTQNNVGVSCSESPLGLEA